MMSATEQPTLLILLGAAGDLAHRLVVPALFRLYSDAMLPEHFRLIGLDRVDLDVGSLISHLREGSERFGHGKSFDEAKWQAFSHCFDYQRMDLSNPESYQELPSKLDALREDFPTPEQRIFYLATPSFLYEPAATGLGRAGLTRPTQRTRVVVEKPIGRDLNSFRHIDRILKEWLDERQIFRMDHYLGKETLQNMLALRFANPIFEPIWDRRYIDHVTITVAESLGVGHRGAYYEQAGALRDMVQNHLMQILCLIAMEPPASFDADQLRDRKMDVMRALRPIPAGAVSEYASRGQYGPGWLAGERVVGYREESGVDAESSTETFAALKLFVDNWRWQDVPFYLRTGKRLAQTVSEVSIQFRPVPHRAYPDTATEGNQPVRLVLRLKPEEGIDLKLNVKLPGADFTLAPADMSFSYRSAFHARVPAAYETLLHEVLCGDQTLFMRSDQIEAAWRLLQPVLEVWENHPLVDFPNYPAGSWGQESAEGLISRDGHSWPTPSRRPEETEESTSVVQAVNPVKSKIQSVAG
ncbi:MAG: glucose-6-phosphate dehydrogenase [Candidatus Thiodiazotropha sp.]